MPRPRTAASRPVPTIACINKAKTPLGVDFDKLIRALQKYVDHHLAPVWRTPAKLVKATRPPRGAWVLMFIDSAEDVDKKHLKDFAYHLFKGHPMARVFVKSTIGNNEPISLVASHEIAEILVNPDCNLWALGPGKWFYSYEICDAVEEEEFKIDGLAMSDFVYPAYFDEFRKPNSVQFDHLKRITQPFQLLAGGYALVRKGQKKKAIYGSKAKQKRFSQEDRHLHRTESMR